MARTPKLVEDRREHIIDAAVRVFSQKGFNKATNKDIAREAGITPGLIYYYFESKEALLKAIIESRSPIKLMTTLPEQMFTLPPEDFLRFLILQALHILEGENFVGLIRVVLPEIIHEDNLELSGIVKETIERIVGFLGSYLDAKIKSNELRSADGGLAAQMILGSIIGFVLRRQLVRDPTLLHYSHEQIAGTVVDTVLRGLLPRS